VQASEAYTRAFEAPSSSSIHETDLLLVRIDGKNGLKSVVSARSALRRLGQLEVAGDFLGVLTLLEELITNCPCSLRVLTSKCNALCRLSKWSEAKECAEQFVCNSHSSVLRLEAHPNAQLPAPVLERLVWTEKPGKNIVTVDTEAVLQAILAMGPGLAEGYISALKNLDINRNCSADIMSRVLLIFDDLLRFLRTAARASQDTSRSAMDLGDTFTLLF
jgi:hypothetical protein